MTRTKLVMSIHKDQASTITKESAVAPIIAISKNPSSPQPYTVSLTHTELVTLIQEEEGKTVTQQTTVVQGIHGQVQPRQPGLPTAAPEWSALEPPSQTVSASVVEATLPLAGAGTGWATNSIYATASYPDWAAIKSQKPLGGQAGSVHTNWPTGAAVEMTPETPSRRIPVTANVSTASSFLAGAATKPGPDGISANTPFPAWGTIKSQRTLRGQIKPSYASLPTTAVAEKVLGTPNQTISATSGVSTAWPFPGGAVTKSGTDGINATALFLAWAAIKLQRRLSGHVQPTNPSMATAAAVEEAIGTPNQTISATSGVSTAWPFLGRVVTKSGTDGINATRPGIDGANATAPYLAWAAVRSQRLLNWQIQSTHSSLPTAAAMESAPKTPSQTISATDGVNGTSPFLAGGAIGSRLALSGEVRSARPGPQTVAAAEKALEIPSDAISTTAGIDAAAAFLAGAAFGRHPHRSGQVQSPYTSLPAVASVVKATETLSETTLMTTGVVAAAPLVAGGVIKPQRSLHGQDRSSSPTATPARGAPETPSKTVSTTSGVAPAAPLVAGGVLRAQLPSSGQAKFSFSGLPTAAAVERAPETPSQTIPVTAGVVAATPLATWGATKPQGPLSGQAQSPQAGLPTTAAIQKAPETPSQTASTTAGIAAAPLFLGEVPKPQQPPQATALAQQEQITITTGNGGAPTQTIVYGGSPSDVQNLVGGMNYILLLVEKWKQDPTNKELEEEVRKSLEILEKSRLFL